MPGFEKEHLPLLRKVPIDAIVGDNKSETNRPGWFRYFWSEAYAWEADFLRKCEPVLLLFSSLFELPAAWARPAMGGWTQAKLKEMEAALPGLVLKRVRDWDAVPPQVLYDALLALLSVGFNRIPIAKNSTIATNDTSVEMAKYLKKFDHSRKVQLGWRGDTRRFTDLVASGGFICKAESMGNNYAANLNMRQPWHPFSKLSIRSDMWYRRVSSDNCKQTIISVTEDFKTAAVFPQLSELHIFPGNEVKQDVAALVNVTPALRSKLAEVTVRRSTGEQVVLLRAADTVQIFLCVLDGVYFDTREAQEKYSRAVPFNEMAVREVPSDNLLAAVTYVRVHHGTTNGEGFTALYDAAASVEVRNELVMRKTASHYTGPQLYQAALMEYERARQSFTAAWSEVGASKAGAKIDMGAPGISTVLEVKVLSDNSVLFRA